MHGLFEWTETYNEKTIIIFYILHLEYHNMKSLCVQAQLTRLVMYELVLIFWSPF